MPATPGNLDATLERMQYGRALKQELLMTSKPDSWVPYAQPLLDAVELFESLGIGYALIGGIAAMFYGRSRFTEDVDFVAVAGHMDIFSANPQVVEDHHFASDCQHKLYHKSGVQVDLWKDEYTDEIIARSLPVQMAGRSVRIIEPHDLIAMKLRAGRLKDDYDISEILKEMAIDDHRLGALVTDGEMARFVEIKKRL